MNAVWYNLPMFHLFWLLPLLGLALAYAARRRRQALRRFADPAMLSRLTGRLSPVRRRWKQLLYLGAVTAVILGLGRPAWNPVPKVIRRQGRDVVFLLDVSRSMLADDLKPNRLERAKLAIGDCLEVLEGDRVALAVFAGNTVLRCPLTQDYGFFRMMLADVGVDSVSRGGTLIGDALRKVCQEVFDRQLRQYKDVVLITDGEDHESFPLEAAKAAGAEGVRLLAVGLGDESGTPVVVSTEEGSRDILRYRGEVVRSRLDADTLRAMAQATPGGRYLPVGTGHFDLGAIYRDVMAGTEKRELESQTVERYEEKFQIFLGIALVLLSLSLVLSERRPRPAACLVLLALLGGTGAGWGDEAARQFRQGNQALAREDYAAALEFYRQAGVEEPHAPGLLFNQGVARLAAGEHEEARKSFVEAEAAVRRLPDPDRSLEARCQLGIGNCHYRECLRQWQTSLEKAAAACREAVLSYQSAQRLDPALAAAGENLTTARLTLKKILHELKERQKQAQAQQEQNKKLQELAERQDQAAKQTREASRANDAQAAERQQRQQQELSRETRELSQEMNANSQMAPEKLQEARQKQDEAEQALAEQRLPEAADKQEQAARALREAQQQQQKEQEQQQQPDPSDPSDKSDPSDLSAADARAILDDERRQQKQRQIRRGGVPRAVDKDW